MYKRSVSTALAVVFLLFGILSSQASAREQQKDKCRGAGLEDKIFCKAGFFLKNTEALGLSEEQVKKIKAIKVDAKKEMIKRDADIEVAALNIETGLKSDEPDAKAINKLVDEKYELKKAKAKYLVENYIGLKSILSKEQKAKMKELWKAKTPGAKTCDKE